MRLVAHLLMIALFAGSAANGVCLCCEIEADGDVCCERPDGASLGETPCCEEARVRATMAADHAKVRTLVAMQSFAHAQPREWIVAPPPHHVSAAPLRVETLRLTSRLLL